MPILHYDYTNVTYQGGYRIGFAYEVTISDPICEEDLFDIENLFDEYRYYYVRIIRTVDGKIVFGESFLEPIKLKDMEEVNAYVKGVSYALKMLA